MAQSVSSKSSLLAINLVDDFNEYRSEMNEKILGADNLVLKPLSNLGTQTYAEGALLTYHL